MKTRLSRLRVDLWVVLASLPIIVAGMLIAAATSRPRQFWFDTGILMAGTALGVMITVLVLDRLLIYRTNLRDKDLKARFLRDIGRDCIGAISRVYGMPSQVTFQGKELFCAWNEIEAGQMPVTGFKTEVYGQLRPNRPPDRNPSREWYDEPEIADSNSNFEIGLLMVTRALSKAYARLDLFEPDDLPLNSLESALATLRTARERGYLTRAAAAMLLSPLCEGVEKCGATLWAMKAFVPSFKDGRQAKA